MKKQANTSLVIRSSLALALALAIWSPVQSQSAEPAEGKNMTEATMTDRWQEMQESKQKMKEDMKAQGAKLTEQLTKMNSTPENKKMSLMAAGITHMVEHMQMGKGSISQCPVMKGMKDMDEKSGDAQKEYK
jgi:uncharacterized protein HemX